VFTATSNTAANIVENSEKGVEQGKEVVKQNAAQGAEAVKQNVAQGAEVVKQNHNQIVENSRTTPTTSDSTAEALPLEEILEMNAKSGDTQEKSNDTQEEPPKPAQPKMVYAIAEDDGSLKVLGKVPEGVSKEQIEKAIEHIKNYGVVEEPQSTRQEEAPGAKKESDSIQDSVPSEKKQSDLTQDSLPGAF